MVNIHKHFVNHNINNINSHRIIFDFILSSVLHLLTEIEDYATDDEKTKDDDHNNNENKKLHNDTLNNSSKNHFGFYQTNSKTNNTNSCFQLQNMSKELSNIHSSSNPYHVPKVKFNSLSC